MPFHKPPEPQTYNAKKTEFMSVVSGNNVIRILDDDYSTFVCHYLPAQKSTVVCLGNECPICQNNKKIIMENPDNFRTVKGYLPKTSRYVVNVIDKSPTKTCKNCGTEIKAVNGKFPPACPNTQCNAFLADVPAMPLNKVKLLAKGKQLFDQFFGLQEVVQDANGNPLNLTDYDITLYVSGTGTQTTITTIPMAANREPIPEGLEKFDHKKAIVELRADEIEQLLRGVAMKDIFKARKPDSTSEVDTSTVSEEVAKDIEDRINSLF